MACLNDLQTTFGLDLFELSAETLQPSTQYDNDLACADTLECQRPFGSVA